MRHPRRIDKPAKCRIKNLQMGMGKKSMTVQVHAELPQPIGALNHKTLSARWGQ